MRNAKEVITTIIIDQSLMMGGSWGTRGTVRIYRSSSSSPYFTINEKSNIPN